jgi:hypothetical protein
VTTTPVNKQFIAGDKNKVAMEVGAAKFIGDVIDTGEKFIAGVVDTSEQFIAVVKDTAEKLFNCVNETVYKFFPGVVETGQITKKPKIYHQCQ